MNKDPATKSNISIFIFQFNHINLPAANEIKQAKNTPKHSAIG